MKRAAGTVLVVTIPLLLFLNVWQGYRYEQMKREVARLEERQRAQLEENRRLLASIAVLGSPARIEKLAREELGLQRLEPRRMQRVTVGTRGAAGAGSAETDGTGGALE